jgi:hypothetical protein
MNINFSFLRHGHGCHNALGPLYKNGLIKREDFKEFLDMKCDPELTQIGVDASLHNGCIVSKILKKIPKFVPEFTLDPVNVVGCSPLIRCMETAYYMTRKWKNPPSKIFIFPYLREINERSDDPYSEESRRIMSTTPSYAMKSISDQKDYLKSRGILEFFDFSYVESNMKGRHEPGDLFVFMKWFAKKFVLTNNLQKKERLSVFITTHAGVLKQFSQESFPNNSGVVVNTTFAPPSKIDFNKLVSLNTMIPATSFFNEYNHPNYNSREYFCPSDRCGSLCTQKSSDNPLKQLTSQCTADDNSLTLGLI